MHEQPDLLGKLITLFIEFWGYLAAGIVTMFLWIGKRQITKFDEVMENYVHQKAHDKAITDMEQKMLTCQESLRSDQRDLLENITGMKNDVKALHGRMDKLMELVVNYMANKH